MTQTDMFLTKEEQLINWMRQKKYFASHEVIQFGLSIFYIRSDRTKRNFLEKGLIKKLTEGEKAFIGYKCKDACYQYVGKT